MPDQRCRLHNKLVERDRVYSATVGSFALETEKINNLQENFPQNLPKWKNSSISDIKKVSDYICDNVIF